MVSTGAFSSSLLDILPIRRASSLSYFQWDIPYCASSVVHHCIKQCERCSRFPISLTDRLCTCGVFNICDCLWSSFLVPYNKAGIWKFYPTKALWIRIRSVPFYFAGSGFDLFDLTTCVIFANSKSSSRKCRRGKAEVKLCNWEEEGYPPSTTKSHQRRKGVPYTEWDGRGEARCARAKKKLSSLPTTLCSLMDRTA